MDENPPNPDESALSQPDRPATETPASPVSATGKADLGVLFVHGIGVQQRGETLVQCCTAAHHWLSRWFSSLHSERGGVVVELVDASITHEHDDDPASTRLIFRTETHLSPTSWLLAESCWAESFRPPSYPAFVKWAVSVLPIAVLLHLGSAFRRNNEILNIAMHAVERGLLSHDDGITLGGLLGNGANDLPAEPGALRKALLNHASIAGTRWLQAALMLVPFLCAAVVAQCVLLAVIVLAVIPVGAVRAFAGWVQRTLSSVLGDSQLFMTSPISAAAAVGQVKRDLAWLAARSRKVAIVAHSQGAAVAHRAITELAWESRVPEELATLLTYGSGLRKLHELKAHCAGFENDLAPLLRLAVLGTLGGGLGFVAGGLWIANLLPWYLFAGIAPVGVLFSMGGLFFWTRGLQTTNPQLPRKCVWKNLYASHDPVPNGPAGVDPRSYSPTGSAGLDDVAGFVERSMIHLFQMGQTEVVNRQSSLTDHTTYWEAQDDFVGKMMGPLLSLSGLSHPYAPDPRWLEVGAERRRWRVGFLVKARRTALLAAICFLLSPAAALSPIGVWSRAELQRIWSLFPDLSWPDWFGRFEPTSGRLGLFVALLALGAVCSITLRGWEGWDRREIRLFLRRKPFQLGGGGWSVFVLGWIVMALGPLGFCWSPPARPSLWTVLLAFLPLAYAGAAFLSVRRGPGTPESWIRELVETGEKLVGNGTDKPAQNATRAIDHLRCALYHLDLRKPSELLLRSAYGLGRLLESCPDHPSSRREDIINLYEIAVDSARTLGQDTKPIEERLARLSATPP